MINKIVMDALKNIGVSVSFQTYSGKKDPYITFFTYLDKGEQFADDGEVITGYYVQIDIWSKKDYTQVSKEVHQNMLAANFIKKGFYDLYEDDLKIYHKVMRFFKEV